MICTDPQNQLLRISRITLSPCAIQSCPTPGDYRGSHLFPLISPCITSFSIPRSSLTTCPKYLKAVCATLDSSVHSGLMFSTTHTLVFLSIHDTLITRLQHHISNASIFFLSAFLIVQVSAPYSTIGNTKAFTGLCELRLDVNKIVQYRVMFIP